MHCVCTTFAGRHVCKLTCLHAYMLTCLHVYMLGCLHAYMLTSTCTQMPKRAHIQSSSLSLSEMHRTSCVFQSYYCDKSRRVVSDEVWLCLRAPHNIFFTSRYNGSFTDIDACLHYSVGLHQTSSPPVNCRAAMQVRRALGRLIAANKCH